MRMLLLGCLLLTACGEDGQSPSDYSFDGYWDFELTLRGIGCPGDVSGQDCFAIHQSGDEVFVVDDLNGNLVGRVSDGVAILSRQSVDESVYLELRMLGGGESVEGFAIEADSTRACTTELDLFGRRRAGPCN